MSLLLFIVVTGPFVMLLLHYVTRNREQPLYERYYRRGMQYEKKGRMQKALACYTIAYQQVLSKRYMSKDAYLSFLIIEEKYVSAWKRELAVKEEAAVSF